MSTDIDKIIFRGMTFLYQTAFIFGAYKVTEQNGYIYLFNALNIFSLSPNTGSKKVETS